MASQRPNTIIVFILLLIEAVKLAWESVYKWLFALLRGKIMPLSTSRLMQLWHWSMASGPKKFWHFPRAIQVGRLISTIIQVIFYPKK